MRGERPVTRAATLSPKALYFVIALSAGNVIAHLCTSAMPLQIGSLIDGYGLSATAAGTVGFFQVGCMAIGMIFFSRIVHRYGLLGVCLCGLAVAAVADVAIFASPAHLALLCLIAAISGVGYALMLSATVAAPAASAQPDRVYAISNSLGLLMLVGVLSLLPFASSYFGVRGVFLGIAITLTASIPLILGLRFARDKTKVAPVGHGDLPGRIPLVIMWSLASMGMGALWPFAERIGHSLQLSGPLIGLILSISVFLSVLGSAAAAFVNSMMDRRVALVIGFAGSGASCLLLSLANGLWMYAITASLFWVFAIYLFVLLLGTSAALDSTGRLATLCTGCERLAYAVGAPIGGLFVDMGSFSGIGIFSAVACLIAVPFCLPHLGRALRDVDADAAIRGAGADLPHASAI